MLSPLPIQPQSTTIPQRIMNSAAPNSILYGPARGLSFRTPPHNTPLSIRTRAFSKTPMPDELDSGYDTDMAEDNQCLSLEQSFDESFALSQKCAFTSVVRWLDLRRRWCKSASPICVTCPEVVWKGHPAQEKLIRACDLYTIQWLADRDTTWCGDALPHGVTNEPESVKAIGAWSLDRATDVVNLIGGVDTVPGAKSGLHDVKSRSSIASAEPVTPARELSSHSVEVNMTDVLKVDQIHITSHNAEQDDSIAEDTDETSNTSGSEVSDEPAIIDSPCKITTLHTPTSNGSWTTSANDTTYIANESNLSTTSQSSQNNHRANTARVNGHKRKRGQQESDDESNRDGAPPRPPNAMPLKDSSAKLACHFWALDREKYCEGPMNGKLYKRCANGFKDSKELRDHLKKKHYGPKLLCSRCNQEFNNCAQKAEHERALQRCEEGSNKELDEERYILVGTKRRVEFERMGKKPKNTSHEEHWFDVWSVLFHDRPFPTTTYTPRDTFDVAYERFADEVVGERFDIPSDVVRSVLQRMKEKLREALRANPSCFDQHRSEQAPDSGQPGSSSSAAIVNHALHPLHHRPTQSHPNLHSDIEVPLFSQYNVEASYEYPDQRQLPHQLNFNNGVGDAEEYEVQFDLMEFHPYQWFEHGSWHRM